MASTEQLMSLVNQLPAPDGRGMFTENLDKQKIEKLAAQIAAGGKDYVLGLIEMLAEPGSAKNVKPHYALHCVINHTLISGNESQRKEFCEALASQLQNRQLHPNNRAYLCQELQWAGRDEACEALGKALLDEDVTDAAATALTAIGGEHAARQLGAAAKKATGKARLNLIDALAALADPESVTVFQQALKDQDREVRIAAAMGLANQGQLAAVDDVFQAADTAKGWERTQLTKACLVLAEKLAAAGKTSAAKKIYQQLQATRTGKPEQHIRDAAERGLAALA